MIIYFLNFILWFEMKILHLNSFNKSPVLFKTINDWTVDDVVNFDVVYGC